jgi:hypothetical protein
MVSRVSPSDLRFYRWVGHKVDGQQVELPDTGKEPLSIPIDNALIEKTSVAVFQKVQAALDASRSQRAAYVIIDIITGGSSFERGGVLVHIAHAIHLFLDQSRSGARVIVLQSTLPPEGDLFRVVLNRWLESGRVILFGDDGLSAGLRLDELVDANAYRSQRLRTRADFKSRLASRLIRRLGHYSFRRSEDRRECRRFFYDARFAVREVASLIRDVVKVNPQTGEMITLLHEPHASTWLLDALIIISEETPVRVLDVDEFLKQGTNSGELNDIVLVLAAVYSGQTASSLLRRLRDVYPEKKVRTISVLMQQGPGRGNGTYKLDVDGKMHIIEYLIEVPQEAVAESGCEMCALGLPLTRASDIDTTAMLSTYDIWDLVRASGWKDEEDPPEHRPRLGKVPRFPELIEQNGPWLAHKFYLVLKGSDGTYLDEDYIIVCPNQVGAIALADSLSSIFGFSVIKIPNDVRRAFSGKSKRLARLLRDWREHEPDWFLQLKSISSGRIIILDEYNASGGTRSTMQKLVQTFGHKPYGYFSLVDWNPASSAGLGVLTWTLYDFQYIASR